MNNGWQFPAGWEPKNMTNEIEFICGDENILKHFPIVPAKDALPEWYSKLSANDMNGVPILIANISLLINSIILLTFKYIYK